jgi:DNA polymerase-4
VTVKIKFADFRQITRSRTFAAVIACQNDLRWASLDLVRSAFPPAKGIRLVGVTVSNFDKRDAESDPPVRCRSRLVFQRSGIAPGCHAVTAY